MFLHVISSILNVHLICKCTQHAHSVGMSSNVYTYVSFYDSIPSSHKNSPPFRCVIGRRSFFCSTQMSGPCSSSCEHQEIPPPESSRFSSKQRHHNKPWAGLRFPAFWWFVFIIYPLFPHERSIINQVMPKCLWQTSQQVFPFRCYRVSNQ